MSTRICIIGNSGSGKSTLATRLGEATGLSVYHLDRYLLDKDFQKLPPAEYKKVHQRLITEESWIIEGNYNKVLPERLSRATLVVFLDISRFITIPRVLRRSRQGGQPAHTIPKGAQAEKISWPFFKWTASYSRRKVIQKIRASGAPLLLLGKASLEKHIAQIQETLKEEGVY